MRKKDCLRSNLSALEKEEENEGSKIQLEKKEGILPFSIALPASRDRRPIPLGSFFIIRSPSLLGKESSRSRKEGDRDRQ